MRSWFILSVVVVPIVLYAAPPAWWTQEPTRIIDSQAQANNYAPVNLGQLKNAAKQSKKHLDAALQSFGGAGSEVTALVDGFGNDPATNYSPINLGQLKKVAKPFYDRMRQVGVDTRQNLISHGYPATWQYDYPWNPATPVSENYVPANLGQLKMVFSFDLAVDSDTDGLPDWWEHSYGLDPNTPVVAGADYDQDGVPDATEFLNGKNPAKKDNPALSITVYGFTTP